MENDNQIKLQVGEKQFITSKETLKESGFFSSLLTRWQHNASPDGSFFIDGDGELFEHILRYLRRGVLPIFCSKEKGHDYAMYGAILQEARYYLIDRLVRWIESKKYLEAVKMKVTTSFHGPFDTKFAMEQKDLITDDVGQDAEIQQTYQWSSMKEFRCPSWQSNNNRACTISCMASNHSRVHTETEMESSHALRIIQVKKEVVFNHELCMEGWSD